MSNQQSFVVSAQDALKISLLAPYLVEYGEGKTGFTSPPDKVELFVSTQGWEFEKEACVINKFFVYSQSSVKLTVKNVDLREGTKMYPLVMSYHETCPSCSCYVTLKVGNRLLLKKFLVGYTGQELEAIINACHTFYRDGKPISYVELMGEEE